MNMKKILAAATASVLTVSAMSVVASAEPLMEVQDSKNFQIDFSGLTEDEVKSITKIEADVSVTTTLLNGCIGWNSVSDANFKKAEQETKDETNTPVSATWTAEMEAGDLAALGEDGSVAPFCEVQFWWIQPVYEGDTEVGKGTATLSSIRLYAGDTVVKEFGEPAGAGEETKPTGEETKPTGEETKPTGEETKPTGEETKPTGEETKPTGEETKPTGEDGKGDKDPVDTGVGGVAAVLGVAVIAAGAMVVAKKRK